MKPANNAPVYCSIYAELAEIFRRHGYALAIHGSLARDFDLVAIPWTEDADNPNLVLDTLKQEFGITLAGNRTRKLHGRVAYSVVFCGGTVFLDLSFMPRKTET